MTKKILQKLKTNLGHNISKKTFKNKKLINITSARELFTE